MTGQFVTNHKEYLLRIQMIQQCLENMFIVLAQFRIFASACKTTACNNDRIFVPREFFHILLKYRIRRALVDLEFHIADIIKFFLEFIRIILMNRASGQSFCKCL